MQHTESKLKPVNEIARLLSVSRFGLYRLIKSGAIPHYQFGRKILMDFQEVRDALRVKS